jgi:hypothetical protein
MNRTNVSNSPDETFSHLPALFFESTPPRHRRQPAIKEESMPPAKSISLRQFTSAVQAAVKAAVKKHPKFNQVEAPQEVTFSYLIRGFLFRPQS